MVACVLLVCSVVPTHPSSLHLFFVVYVTAIRTLLGTFYKLFGELLCCARKTNP